MAIVFLGGTAALLIVALLGTTLGGDHPTWGPFRGRFVDADTGEPIRGAVAYAIWLRIVPNPLHATQTFDDVRFAVSNDAGEFEIPARRRPLLPFGVEGPFLDYAAQRYKLASVNERDRSYAVIRMRQLSRLPESERSALAGAGGYNLIPHERVRDVLDQINNLRRRMGLPPFETLGG